MKSVGSLLTLSGLILMSGLSGCDPDGAITDAARSAKRSSSPTVTATPFIYIAPKPSNAVGGKVDQAPIVVMPTVPPASGANAAVTEPLAPRPATPSGEAPAVRILNIVTTPPSLILYLPAGVASRSLGFPEQAALVAYAQRSDGTRGGVQWFDRSGGQLSVSSGGLVTVNATASAGSTYVRVRSLDDESVYLDVPVELRSTSELAVTIR